MSLDAARKSACATKASIGVIGGEPAPRERLLHRGRIGIGQRRGHFRRAIVQLERRRNIMDQAQASASGVEKTRLVSASSIARRRPSANATAANDGSFHFPSRIPVRPKLVPCAATTTWALATSARPPDIAMPCTAATIGFAMVRPMRNRSSGSASAPAQKIGPSASSRIAPVPYPPPRR